MLKTDRPIYKLIIMLNLLLLVAGLVMSMLNILQAAGEVTRILMNAFYVVTMLFGIVYILYGYEKNAAKFFLFYGYALAASVAGTLMNSFSNGVVFLLVPLFVLMLAVIFVLVVKENLGKKRSFACGGALAFLSAAALIASLFGNGPHLIAGAAVLFVLSCLFGVMIYAKYLDKSARGTN